MTVVPAKVGYRQRYCACAQPPEISPQVLDTLCLNASFCVASSPVWLFLHLDPDEQLSFVNKGCKALREAVCIKYSLAADYDLTRWALFRKQDWKAHFPLTL